MLKGWPRNDVCEHHDPHVQHWIKEYVRAGDVFYDLGANVGIMSQVAARKGALVVAFEPLPSAMVELRAVLPESAILVNAAVWDVPAVLPLRPTNESGGCEIAVASEPGTLAVGAFPLPFFGLPKPNVMKLDIEGSECHAMNGCTPEFLAQCRVIITEVYGPALEALGGSEHELRELIEGFGFGLRAQTDRDLLYVR